MYFQKIMGEGADRYGALYSVMSALLEMYTNRLSFSLHSNHEAGNINTISVLYRRIKEPPGAPQLRNRRMFI